MVMHRTVNATDAGSSPAPSANTPRGMGPREALK